ncbi:type II secretion system F family protein [Aquipuribacter sp. SD81]|uniref:type II secretion system F family protein n=1 Tax=Aquipuribacter sp. SD81 TaxID=3127703 RepID=UPI00301A3C38
MIESIQNITGALFGSPLLVVGVGAIFLAVLLGVGSLLLAPTANQAAVSRSLAAVEALQSAPRSMRQQELEQPLRVRALDPAFGTLTRLGRRLTPDGQVARIRKRLDLAGNPTGWDVDRVVSLKVLLSFVLGAFTALVCLLASTSPFRAIVGVGLALAIGWFAPSLIVYQMAAKRSERIQKSLPDALDLLTISVESGLAFDAALAQVSRNTDGPLAAEFFRVLQEMQIGTGRMAAMRAMADRTDVADLKSFVAAMVQADSYGVPIASALRTQADEMRVKRSQRAEEAAQKVPVKILFPLIFGIMPTLFVVIIGPGVIQTFLSFSNL